MHLHKFECGATVSLDLQYDPYWILILRSMNTSRCVRSKYCCNMENRVGENDYGFLSMSVRGSGLLVFEYAIDAP